MLLLGMVPFMNQENQETDKTILTKCWADPDFKQRLIADPVKTLRTEGVTLPDGIKVNVVENTATEFTFVIPPETSELSDDELTGVVGGVEGAAQPKIIKVIEISINSFLSKKR